VKLIKKNPYEQMLLKKQEDALSYIFLNYKSKFP